MYRDKNSSIFDGRVYLSCSSCPKRGPTRGITFAKKRKPGERFDIVVPEDRKRIAEQNASNLITEVGIVVRQFAPLEVEKWKDIPIHDKEKMWGALKDKFCLSSEDKVMKTVVYKQLNNHYRNFRNRLHKKYYLPHKIIECALQYCPPEVDETQWKALCAFFNSDDFKKRSEKNKENRAKQTIVHAGGSCGFARHEYKLAAKDENRVPGMAELWKTTHWSTKKEAWVNEQAGQVYDQARVNIDSLKVDGVEVDGDQVFRNILGPKKCYVLGRGPGPKLPSSTFEASARESTKKELVARKEAEEARKEAEQEKKEAAEVNQKLTELENRLSSKFKILMEFIAQTHGNLPEEVFSSS